MSTPRPDQQVLLLRHGETEWSRDGRHTGRADIPLTDVGEAQARAAAAALGDWQAAPVWCSPRIRAQRTAELAGLSVTVTLDRLAEWDYGDYEGRRTPEIQAERPGWYLWRDGAPGGEDARQVGERADAVLQEIRGSDVLRVVLVGHGHMLRVLIARYLELSPDCGRLFALPTAGIAVLGTEHHRPVLTRLG